MLVFAPVTNFNPRSPYGERPPNCWPTAKRRLFQSTLPLRGATRRIGPTGTESPNFNPRSPYGERRSISFNPKKSKRFQSTLPLRGATGSLAYSDEGLVFQSTLPLRGATITYRLQSSCKLFQSTLPLRGATGEKVAHVTAADHFNPRSPYGERPQVQSSAARTFSISIHAPLTGSDQ